MFSVTYPRGTHILFPLDLFHVVSFNPAPGFPQSLIRIEYVSFLNGLTIILWMLPF
jgi:hypothetical protein